MTAKIEMTQFSIQNQFPTPLMRRGLAKAALVLMTVFERQTRSLKWCSIEAEQVGRNGAKTEDLYSNDHLVRKCLLPFWVCLV